jgi:hypothetical protein
MDYFEILWRLLVFKPMIPGLRKLEISIGIIGWFYLLFVSFAFAKAITCSFT